MPQRDVHRGEGIRKLHPPWGSLILLVHISLQIVAVSRLHQITVAILHEISRPGVVGLAPVGGNEKAVPLNGHIGVHPGVLDISLRVDGLNGPDTGSQTDLLGFTPPISSFARVPAN